MSAIIKRVARALAIAAGHTDPDDWEMHVVDARAALVAMREPTKPMLKRIAMEACHVSGTCYESMGWCADTDDYDTARDCWTAGIDEALK